GNAAMAMPDGGTLTVRLSASASPESRRAEVSVEDSGPGVPPEVLPKLFSPFVTSRAGAGGTGLGLYMCRETARRHGGELSAFNRPGGGATFVVRLPLERTAPLGAPNAGDGAKDDRVVSLA
ncbi:MAG: ATP-binding protein, partial [Thermodesulfobacteriota bacterium]